MLLTLSIAVVLSAAPQGRVVLVSALEAQGATPVQLAMVRDAVVLELKAQGYDARAEELGPAPTATGAVVADGTVDFAKRLSPPYADAQPPPPHPTFVCLYFAICRHGGKSRRRNPA